ncbi:histidine kinase [Nocardiopsis sp. NPDC006198]|uniref:sensor histidine kinase n=1 Tax=Nocardiopsis sp. NPDC006198 TaxID=3154472 RepID=UPI0033B4C360
MVDTDGADTAPVTGAGGPPSAPARRDAGMRRAAAVVLSVVAVANGLFCQAIMPGAAPGTVALGVAVMVAASLAAPVARPEPLTSVLVTVAACVLLVAPDSVWRDLSHEGGLVWPLLAVAWCGAVLVREGWAPRHFALGGAALAGYVAVATAVALPAGGPVLVTVLNAAAPVLGGASLSLWARLGEARRERVLQEERERALLTDRARADERRRLAAEMHDVVSHQVSLMVLQAGALAVATSDPGVREAADGIRAAGSRAIEELRGIMGVLREDRAADAEHPDAFPAGPAEPGPDPAVLAEEARAAGQRVELTVTGAPAGAAPHTARAVYRIVQEGLTNARKHAPGSGVGVDLRYRPDAVVVEVVNSAPVTSPDPLLAGGGAGSGLEGLRQRVDLLGGTFAAGPDGGGGFRIGAVLPDGNRTGEAP